MRSALRIVHPSQFSLLGELIGERYYITLETFGETFGVVFVLCPHK